MFKEYWCREGNVMAQKRLDSWPINYMWIQLYYVWNHFINIDKQFHHIQEFFTLTSNLHPMWVYLVQKTPRFKIPYPYAKLLTSKICYILDPSVPLVSNNFSFGDLIIWLSRKPYEWWELSLFFLVLFLINGAYKIKWVKTKV